MKSETDRQFVAKLAKKGVLSKHVDHTGQIFYVIPGNRIINKTQLSNETNKVMENPPPVNPKT